MLHISSTIVVLFKMPKLMPSIVCVCLCVWCRKTHYILHPTSQVPIYLPDPKTNYKNCVMLKIVAKKNKTIEKRDDGAILLLYFYVYHSCNNHRLTCTTRKQKLYDNVTKIQKNKRCALSHFSYKQIQFFDEDNFYIFLLSGPPWTLFKNRTNLQYKS